MSRLNKSGVVKPRAPKPCTVSPLISNFEQRKPLQYEDAVQAIFFSCSLMGHQSFDTANPRGRIEDGDEEQALRFVQSLLRGDPRERRTAADALTDVLFRSATDFYQRIDRPLRVRRRARPQLPNGVPVAGGRVFLRRRLARGDVGAGLGLGGGSGRPHPRRRRSGVPPERRRRGSAVPQARRRAGMDVRRRLPDEPPRPLHQARQDLPPRHPRHAGARLRRRPRRNRLRHRGAAGCRFQRSRRRAAPQGWRSGGHGAAATLAARIPEAADEVAALRHRRREVREGECGDPMHASRAGLSGAVVPRDPLLQTDSPRQQTDVAQVRRDDQESERPLSSTRLRITEQHSLRSRQRSSIRSRKWRRFSKMRQFSLPFC